MVGIILARTKDGLIGDRGIIPWKIPEDLKRFKKITLNSSVIMGSKTFRSIGFKQLPNRSNFVLSKNFAYDIPGLHPNGFQFEDPTRALLKAIEVSSNGDVWIIGGSKIYDLYLNGDYHIDVVEETLVDLDVTGDTYMNYDFNEKFKIVKSEKFNFGMYNKYEKK